MSVPVTVNTNTANSNTGVSLDNDVESESLPTNQPVNGQLTEVTTSKRYASFVNNASADRLININDLDALSKEMEGFSGYIKGEGVLALINRVGIDSVITFLNEKHEKLEQLANQKNISLLKASEESGGVTSDESDKPGSATFVKRTEEMEQSLQNKIINLAKLMHLLQMLFLESAWAEAQAVIKEIFQNVTALLKEAKSIIEFAKEVKANADKGSWTKFAAGIGSIVGAAAGFGGLYKIGNAMPGIAHAPEVLSRAISGAVDGGARVANVFGDKDSTAANETQMEGSAAQKSIQAIQNEAQAAQQRAAQWEQYFDRLIQSMKQFAEQLLQELTQSFRSVARNI